MQKAPKRPVPIRPCAQCQTPFKPRDNQHTGRYCSQRCAGAARGLKPKPCEWCGKIFQPSHNGAMRFCNRICSARWNGKNRPSSKGFVISKAGYKLLWMPEHPQSHSQKGYILEHRWVMQQMIGRPLSKGEVVHHKNGVKTDNHPDNLELMLKGDHDKLNLPRQSTLSCPHCQGKIVTSRPVRIVGIA